MPDYIKSLTIFWAMSECLLGGIMHMLKVPFTGIIVGGISVICIGLIAIYSNGDKLTLLKSLGLVLSVKLLASPHSPWQAYIAVSFQGLMGALILCRNMVPSKVSITFFAIIALLESSIQKALVLVLIYGIEFFQAFDELINQVTGSIGIENPGPGASLILFSIYLILHLMGGLLIGIWIPKIPRDLEILKSEIPLELLTQLNKNSSQNTKFQAFNYKLVFQILLLLSIAISVFLLLPEKGREFLFSVLLRVILVSFALFYIVGPLIKTIYFKILRPNNKENPELITIIEKIPIWRQYIENSIRWVKAHYSGVNRIKYLILTLLLISLHTRE